MNTDDPRFELIHRCRDGNASPDELARLEALLREDAAFRLAYVRYTNLDLALEAKASSSEAAHDLLKASVTSRSTRWLQWRPLAAAAAGIVFGIFCTSLVFAYVAPSLGTVFTLLQESFESGPAPLVTGVPVEPGRWSGDYTEVVGEEQGVKPESGEKMLRFLKADYEGRQNANSSRLADVFRLIDMRPYRQEFTDGSAVVQLSAGFNAFVFPQGEDYSCRMTLHAFDAETATNGSLRNASVWDETCLAAASAGPVRLYRNPTNWRRLHSDLRVPATTDFLLIHLTISAQRGAHPVPGFGGHYIDDVRLTLRHGPVK